MTVEDDYYRVYMVKLPPTVRGACRVDAEGFASIYINDQLSPKAKHDAFLHEIRHFRQDDHFNSRPIREIES